MTFWFAALAFLSSPAPEPPPAGITVPDGYTVSVYCEGIRGVDGLAVSPSGVLHAVSESEGAVYRVDDEGSLEMLLNGLFSPEGIAFDSSGTMYVVEDVRSGRLLAHQPGSSTEVMVEDLLFPEGVTVSSDGSVFVTGSSAQGGGLPPFMTTVSRAGKGDSGRDTLITVNSTLLFWSYSGIETGPDGTLYVCNETSGFPLAGESVIWIDPGSGEWGVLCRGLAGCEGLSFGADGDFPLFVVEEDTGNGSGRISLVDESGTVTVFAEGFGNIEDVAVDGSGRIFVSEDTSGRVIVIESI